VRLTFDFDNEVDAVLLSMEDLVYGAKGFQHEDIALRYWRWSVDNIETIVE